MSRLGSLLLALGAVTAHAAPSAVVVPEAEGAREVAGTVAALLQQAGVNAKVSRGTAAGCAGQAAAARLKCLAELAGQTDATIVVSVVEVRDRLAVALEAISRRAPRSLGEAQFQGKREALQALAKEPVAQLASSIRSVARAAPAAAPAPTPTPSAKLKETEPPPSPVAEAPPPKPAEPEAAPEEELKAKPVLAPPAEPAPPPAAVASESPPPPASKMPAVITTALCVLAGIVAGVFAGLAAQDDAQLHRQMNGISPLRYSEAEALVAQNHRNFAIAFSGGVVFVALGVLSGVLWAR